MVVAWYGKRLEHAPDGLPGSRAVESFFADW